MLNNWFKKEKPFVGFAGFGGGATGLAFVGGGEAGLTATGGIISEYTSGSDFYRAHIFTSPGTLNVTEPGSFGDIAEVLVVAGGGGGGTHSGGGGGAGGLLLYGSPNGSKTANGAGRELVAGRTYPVVVGDGGVGGHGSWPNPPDSIGGDGVDSSFNDPGGPNFVATGGGGGGNQSSPGRPGGSGGGGGRVNPGGTGVSGQGTNGGYPNTCLLYTSPSPRD